MTEKDIWYYERILWRAKKHNLFDKKNCVKFSDLPENHAILIKKNIYEDINPVIVFWEDETLWTVLGTRAICSFYEQRLTHCDLDEIHKEVSIYYPSNLILKDVKFNSNFILLKKNQKIIWAPAGSELFALMNILLMFPLKK